MEEEEDGAFLNPPPAGKDSAGSCTPLITLSHSGAHVSFPPEAAPAAATDEDTEELDPVVVAAEMALADMKAVGPSRPDMSL